MAKQSPRQTSLDEVPIGESALVTGFVEGSSPIRLVELGFIPGSTVTPLRKAPLGDPIEYALVGGRVALRASDASFVLVRRQP